MKRSRRNIFFQKPSGRFLPDTEISEMRHVILRRLMVRPWQTQVNLLMAGEALQNKPAAVRNHCKIVAKGLRPFDTVF